MSSPKSSVFASAGSQIAALDRRDNGPNSGRSTGRRKKKPKDKDDGADLKKWMQPIKKTTGPKLVPKGGGGMAMKENSSYGSIHKGSKSPAAKARERLRDGKGEGKQVWNVKRRDNGLKMVESPKDAGGRRGRNDPDRFATPRVKPDKADRRSVAQKLREREKRFGGEIFHQLIEAEVREMVQELMRSGLEFKLMDDKAGDIFMVLLSEMVLDIASKELWEAKYNAGLLHKQMKQERERRGEAKKEKIIQEDLGMGDYDLDDDVLEFKERQLKQKLVWAKLDECLAVSGKHLDSIAKRTKWARVLKLRYNFDEDEVALLLPMLSDYYLKNGYPDEPPAEELKAEKRKKKARSPKPALAPAPSPWLEAQPVVPAPPVRKKKGRRRKNRPSPPVGPKRDEPDMVATTLDQGERDHDIRDDSFVVMAITEPMKGDPSNNYPWLLGKLISIDRRSNDCMVHRWEAPKRAAKPNQAPHTYEFLPCWYSTEQKKMIMQEEPKDGFEPVMVQTKVKLTFAYDFYLHQGKVPPVVFATNEVPAPFPPKKSGWKKIRAFKAFSMFGKRKKVPPPEEKEEGAVQVSIETPEEGEEGEAEEDHDTFGL